MKILQVISSFPPAYSYGGALKVAFDISKELVNQNHDVTVYTTDVYDSKSRLSYKTNPEIMAGIKVFRFRNISNILSRKNFTFAPKMFFFLKHHIKEFDVIHLHEYRSFQAIFVSYFAKKNNTPYIIQAHGAVLPIFEKQELKKIFDKIFGIKILNYASKLIAVSKVEREQYLTMGIPENKIEIIPNGIDVSEYEILPVRGNFRKRYGIRSDEKVILFLGRLHKSKGIDFLIDGFSSLLEQCKNIKLVIAGPDDGYIDSLTQQIKKLKIEHKVLITGPLYNNEKIETFVDADVLIYPGRIEIFGLVPFEALMCGTPVIVTEDCGCGEIIKEADCGFLVKYGDTQELCNILGNVLLKPNETNAKTQRGQLFIHTSLNWETISIQVRNLYADCLCNL